MDLLPHKRVQNTSKNITIKIKNIIEQKITYNLRLAIFNSLKPIFTNQS